MLLCSALPTLHRTKQLAIPFEQAVVHRGHTFPRMKKLSIQGNKSPKAGPQRERLVAFLGEQGMARLAEIRKVGIHGRHSLPGAWNGRAPSPGSAEGGLTNSRMQLLKAITTWPKRQNEYPRGSALSRRSRFTASPTRCQQRSG